MTKEHCFFRQAAVEISEAATEPTLQCLLREAHRGGALSTDFQVPIPMSDTPLHVHHFDTDSLEQKDRFRYWADRFSRSVGYAGLESPNRDDFHQHLSILEVPGVARFQRQQGSGIAVRSEPGQVQGVETYPFYLMLKLGNGATTVAQGREALIETGDMVLLDASRDALQCERLDAALRMLRTAANSNTYMAQIAYRCGFSDAAYFGLVFRKVFGCTPRAYGRRLLGVGPEDDEMSAAEVS